MIKKALVVNICFVLLGCSESSPTSLSDTPKNQKEEILSLTPTCQSHQTLMDVVHVLVNEKYIPITWANRQPITFQEGVSDISNIYQVGPRFQGISLPAQKGEREKVFQSIPKASYVYRQPLKYDATEEKKHQYKLEEVKRKETIEKMLTTSFGEGLVAYPVNSNTPYFSHVINNRLTVEAWRNHGYKKYGEDSFISQVAASHYQSYHTLTPIQSALTQVNWDKATYTVAAQFFADGDIESTEVKIDLEDQTIVPIPMYLFEFKTKDEGMVVNKFNIPKSMAAILETTDRIEHLQQYDIDGLQSALKDMNEDVFIPFRRCSANVLFYPQFSGSDGYRFQIKYLIKGVDQENSYHSGSKVMIEPLEVYLVGPSGLIPKGKLYDLDLSLVNEDERWVGVDKAKEDHQ